MIRLVYTLEDSARDSSTGERSLTTTQKVLEFDAVEAVAPTLTAELTQKAVEGGVTSEHKRTSQRLVTVEAWVTNTPINSPPPGGTDSPVTAIQVEGAGGLSVLGFDQPFDRVRGVFNELEFLRSNPIPIALSTPTQDYAAVQLVSIDAPTTKETGVDAIRFTLEFAEPRIVQTVDGDVPLPIEPRGARVEEEGGINGNDSDGGEADPSYLSELVTRFSIGT